MIGNEIPMTTLDDCSAVREPPDCGLTAEFSAFLKAVCEADKEVCTVLIRDQIESEIVLVFT